MSQPAENQASPISEYDAARAAMMNTYAPPETVFVRGEGAYLYTEDGEKYLDFFAGIAVNSLGHCHPELVSTLQTQAANLWHLSNAYRVPQGEKLAKTLVSLAGFDQTDGRVFFTNSGTESVECGLKMMRRYHFDQGHPHKNRIIGTSSAFHGRTFASICAAGNPVHTKGFTRDDEGYDHAPFGDLDAIAALMSENTAGVIVEPVQGEGGIHVASAEYLQGLRALCDQFGALLMFDEVQCGIARTGKVFGFEHAGVQPDIIALAKGMGGGFPVGACIANGPFAASMVVGTHGSTYGGNPLAMAVATKVIELVTKPEFLERVSKVAGEFHCALHGLANKYPDLIDEIRGKGLMAGIRFKPADANAEIMKLAREQKMLTTKAGDNVLRLLPPLIITKTEVDEAIEKLDMAMQQYSAGE
jgi:acetylornithine/N-succinyldiaminopimelate aminotransferase